MPLFRQILGSQVFDALPEPVRRLHLQAGTMRWDGAVDVVRGRGWLARLCAWATRLPPDLTGPIAVEIEVGHDDRRGAWERWTRHVGGHAMRSRLWASDGLLTERLGLVDFSFRLDSADQDIVWTVVGVRVLGVLPLPATWFSAVRARESAQGDRYLFEVTAALPLAGPLVRYGGWLEVP